MRQPHADHRRCGACLARYVAWLLVIVPTVTTQASEWTLQPVVRTEFETNDNRALTTGSQERVNGVVLDTSAQFGKRTERDDIKLTPRLRSVRYSGGADFDSDDSYLDGSWSSQVTPRDTWLLGANYARNSTLTTEQSDVGLVAVRKPRRAWSINPSWTTLLTERSSLAVSAGRNDVGYRDAEDTALVSYLYDHGDIAWTYQLTPRTDAGVTFYASRMDVPSNGNITTDAGVQLNASHRLTETTRMTMAAGWHRNEFEVDVAESSARDSESGWLAAFSATRQADTSSLKLDVSRSINPSGFGFLVRTDEATLLWNRKLSARQDASIALRAFATESVEQRSASDNRRYQRAEVRWAWKLTPECSLSAGYVYTRHRFENAPETAHSNAMLLTLGYTPPRWSVAR